MTFKKFLRLISLVPDKEEKILNMSQKSNSMNFNAYFILVPIK